MLNRISDRQPLLWAEALSRSMSPTPPTYRTGDRVEVLMRDGRWYPGRVRSVLMARTGRLALRVVPAGPPAVREAARNAGWRVEMLVSAASPHLRRQQGA